MDHDTLSDVLRNVRLRGAVFFSVSGSSGWVAEAPRRRTLRRTSESVSWTEGSCR